MLEILNQIYSNAPDFIPVLFIICIIWGAAGWFYVQVLGKEAHDYIIVSVLVAIALLAIFMVTSPYVRILFFETK